MTRKAEEKSLEPEEVAAAVVEALTSASPKARCGTPPPPLPEWE